MRLPLNDPPAISNPFGVPDPNAKFGRHAGVDYPVATGTPVYACISGQVSTVFNDQYHGNAVDIQNGGKWYRVMHLRNFVVTGGPVKEGQLIAYSDNTGLSTGPHLHWDVRTEYNPTSFAAFIDPLTLLGEEEEVIWNEGDRVNVNNALYGMDKGYHKEYVNTKTYKEALEAVFGSADFLREQFFNAGDGVNLSSETGWPSEPALIGWLHKRVNTDYITPKVKLEHQATPPPMNVTKLTKGQYLVE